MCSVRQRMKTHYDWWNENASDVVEGDLDENEWGSHHFKCTNSRINLIMGEIGAIEQRLHPKSIYQLIIY